MSENLKVTELLKKFIAKIIKIIIILMVIF